MLRSVAAIALAVLSGVASAQGFPSRPLRILVPFPPGGGTDVAARTLGEHLTRELGQPVVVDSSPWRQLLTGAKPEGR